MFTVIKVYYSYVILASVRQIMLFESFHLCLDLVMVDNCYLTGMYKYVLIAIHEPFRE